MIKQTEVKGWKEKGAGWNREREQKEIWGILNREARHGEHEAKLGK